MSTPCSNMNIIASSVEYRTYICNDKRAMNTKDMAAGYWLKNASHPNQQRNNATLAVLTIDGE